MRSNIGIAILSALGVLPAAFAATTQSTPERKSTVASRGRRVDIDHTGEWLNRPRRRVGPLNAKKAKALRRQARSFTRGQPECVYVLEERSNKMPTVRLKAGCGRDMYKAMKNGMFVS